MAKRILLVEDDLSLGEIYGIVFTNSGYNFETAIDGEDAVRKIRENRFDLVLLDIMLPKLNGLQVLKALKASDESVREVPVILLTNLSHMNTIREAFDLGAKAYLLKASLTPAELVDKVGAFFNGNTHINSRL